MMESLTAESGVTHSNNAVPRGWTSRHLLGLQGLSAEELTILLEAAQVFRDDPSPQPWNLLGGKVVCNLFFEDSTRTRTSFALAARKLGANVVEFNRSSSSLSKGESFIDTARNLEALGAEIIVVRHKSPGTPLLLAQSMDVAVINAGDGTHEHPTQGLLDLLTIRQVKQRIADLTVVLLGDIAHSRVARSNIWALRTLGAKIIVCGPKTLIPQGIDRLGVEISYHLDDVVHRADVINILRIQFERQTNGLFPSIREYAHLFGMNGARLRRAKPDVLILAPGPINRGVEISPEVADGPNSHILAQVTNGLAVRMAAMSLVSGLWPTRPS